MSGQAEIPGSNAWAVVWGIMGILAILRAVESGGAWSLVLLLLAGFCFFLGWVEVQS